MAGLNFLKGFGKKGREQDNAEKMKELATQTAKLRALVQSQKIIDQEFDENLAVLQKDLFDKKTTALEFWEQYKILLRESIQKNDDQLEEIITKTDDQMKQLLKQAQENPTPHPDLSLPK